MKSGKQKKQKRPSKIFEDVCECCGLPFVSAFSMGKSHVDAINEFNKYLPPLRRHWKYDDRSGYENLTKKELKVLQIKHALNKL